MYKKIFILMLIFASVSCGDNTRLNDCFRGVFVSELLEFRLPAYQKLLTNGGSLTARIDGRSIHIIRNNASNYVAFDLECPERSCGSTLDISNLPQITCPCHDKAYNYLQGGQLIGEEGCGLLMYSVLPIGDNAIQIKN